MNNYSGYVGYIKVRGSDIENGVLGARESAQALLAFDGTVRSLLIYLQPELGKVEFEIPIKVREGSWEALIPTTVGGWIAGSGYLATTAYVTAAATQLAQNDFKDKKLTDVTKDAIKLFKGVIRIAKHAGKMGHRDVGKGAKFEDNNETVLLSNDEGIILRTSRAELEAYLRTPAQMLADVARILNEERTFAVGEVQSDGTTSEETITYAQRGVFTDEDEEDADETDDTLFPELEHDQEVTLQGRMTRGNSLTNTIGFRYNGHILTCTPYGTPFTTFPKALFKDCIMHGHVSRLTESGSKDAKRPKIIFDSLVPAPKIEKQVALV